MFTRTVSLITQSSVFRAIGIFVLLCLLTSVPLTQKAGAQSVSELQAMINQLMAQIEVLSSSAGQSLTGKQVITTSALRVRATAATDGRILLVVPRGSVGTVLAGPTSAGGVRWYQVRFNNGGSGWVSGEWLAEVTGKQVVDVNSFVRTAAEGNSVKEVGAQDEALATIWLSPVSYDRYVNKVVLEFSPAEDNEVSQPWVVFEDVSLWSRGWKVLEVDAANPSAWKKVGTTYQIAVFTGNSKIAANRAYELIAAVSTDEDTPSGDRWIVRAPKQGVVIWSELNGHMTNAGPLTAYPLKFKAPEQATDAAVVVQELDTSASTNRDGEAQFEITFEVTASDEDLYIKNFTHRTGTKNPGVKYNVDGPSEENITATLSSSADEITNGVFEVEEGDTEEFTLNVKVVTTMSGQFRVTLDGISYSVDPSGTQNVKFVVPEDGIVTKFISVKAAGLSGGSPDGASISVTTGGSLKTEHGVWTFGNAGASGGSVILLNGKQAGNGSAVELHVMNGKVFALNNRGSWYEWRSNTRWVRLDSNPLGSSPEVSINLSVNSSSVIDSKDRIEIAYSVDPVPAQGTIRAYIKNMANGADYPLISTFLLSQEVNKIIDLAQQPPATMPKKGTWVFSPSFAPSLLPVKGPLVVEVAGANGYVVRKEIPLIISKTSLPVESTMSPDGASISVTTGGSLKTEHGVWTFGNAGAIGGSVILLNGVQAAGGSALELHYKQGKVFARNMLNVWYEWRSNTSWIRLTTNPLQPSTEVVPTVTTSTTPPPGVVRGASTQTVGAEIATILKKIEQLLQQMK